MNLKKLFFLLSILCSPALYANPILNVAILIEKDPINRHRFSQEESQAIKRKTGPVVSDLILALNQKVDLVIASAALVRSLFHLKKGNNLQHYRIYRAKNSYAFAVLVSNECRKKFEAENDTLLRNMSLNAKNLVEVDRSNIQVFKKNQLLHGMKQGYANSLVSIFLNGSDVKKIVYLSGHGEYNKSIASLNKQEYIRLLDKLNYSGCLLLYVVSCFAGGKNAVDIHKNMPKINFPIFYDSFNDSFSCSLWSAIYASNFRTFYTTLQKVFSSKKINNRMVLDAIGGLKYPIDNKQFLSKKNVKLNMIGLIWSLIIHGLKHRLMYSVWPLIITLIMSTKNYLTYKMGTSHQKTLRTLYRAYDVNQNIVPIQICLSTENDTVIIENKVNKKNIIVKNKDHLVISSPMFDGTITIAGKMPNISSYIQGPAHHYIEKIEAKTITFEELIKGFIQKDVVPKKLFVIGALSCKDFNGSDIIICKLKTTLDGGATPITFSGAKIFGCKKKEFGHKIFCMATDKTTKRPSSYSDTFKTSEFDTFEHAKVEGLPAEIFCNAFNSTVNPDMASLFQSRNRTETKGQFATIFSKTVAKLKSINNRTYTFQENPV